MRLVYYVCVFFVLLSCKDDSTSLIIAGDIEDPKNEIAKTIVHLLNENSNGAIEASLEMGALPSLDSLENNAYQLMIVDNNIGYRSEVSVIAPLYPQILHILHRKDYKPTSFNELVSGKKIYAGLETSGSYRITQDLIKDFQVDIDDVGFVNTLNLFDADVIILFTGLMSTEEFIDLKDYEFYSLDDSKKIKSGSIVASICLRHPEFKPYILPSYVYGDLTPKPTVTVANEALLVCRKDLSNELVYDISKVIHQNKQMFSEISPLLAHGINEDFDKQSLAFSLHTGARDYLERNEPTILERNSDFIGILLTVLFTFVSGAYSLYNYRKIKKKDKIDVYYERLIDLRLKINQYDKKSDLNQIVTTVNAMQNETIGLVVKEKLSANDSFLVFLRLCDLVVKEAKEALAKFN